MTITNMADTTIRSSPVRFVTPDGSRSGHLESIPFQFGAALVLRHNYKP